MIQRIDEWTITGQNVPRFTVPCKSNC